MSIIAWIIFGIITGVVVEFLDTRFQTDSLADAIILGVIGAILGGSIATVLFNFNIMSLHLTSLAIASASAIVVLLIGRIVKRM